jgi:hypothetical protein
LLILSDELDAELRLAHATKTVNDEDLATRMTLLGEEVFLQSLHVTDSLHEMIDCGDTLQTERDCMFVLDS